MVNNPDLMLWNIKGLMCNVKAEDGFSLTIWASPRFLKIAEKIELDEERKKRFQDTARTIIREAGFENIYNSEDFLKFGKLGLVSFDVPGTASGMYIEYDEVSDISIIGAEFVSHNISDPLQQSVLIKIWLMWAKFIESEAQKNYI